MTAEDRMMAALWRWLLMFLVAAVVLIVAVSAVLAHDHNRPGLDKWYESLKSGRGPCCGGPSVDATTLDGPDWELRGGKYRVRIEGIWVDVPDAAIVNEPNIDGRTLVWPVIYRDGNTIREIQIRCFMPGALI
jgi:hypothetical protein